MNGQVNDNLEYSMQEQQGTEEFPVIVSGIMGPYWIDIPKERECFRMDQIRRVIKSGDFVNRRSKYNGGIVMDIFDKTMKDMKNLSAIEQGKILEEKKAQCICQTCPTYTSCSLNEQEKFFCGIGKSFMCISYEKECICQKCQVKKDLGLTYKYYCSRGDEKGQRYQNSVWGSTLAE